MFSGAGAGDDVAELGLDEIGKIRSVRSVDAATHGGNFHWLCFCAISFFTGNRSSFSHRVEHLIASRRRRVEFLIRVVTIRTANQDRKSTRLNSSHLVTSY